MSEIDPPGWVSEGKTEVFPRPEPPEQLSLINTMRARPGSLLLFAAEWAGIALVAIGLLTIVFLLCVGGYELVQTTS
jgi:hypothetical protein